MSKIAVVGGTGQLGNAIAKRLVKAGHQVAIGSRSAESAKRAAMDIGAASFGENARVATDVEFVIVAVPYFAQAEKLRGIRDVVRSAIVIDTTVPLVPPKVTRVQLPAAGSAAAEAREHLGPHVRLVTAFHNAAAHRLAICENVDCDILVFSDDSAAQASVVSLINGIGLRGLAAGALINSAAAEAITSILIFMNKTYGVDGAGIRFTGLTSVPPAS